MIDLLDKIICTVNMSRAWKVKNFHIGIHLTAFQPLLIYISLLPPKINQTHEAMHRNNWILCICGLSFLKGENKLLTGLLWNSSWIIGDPAANPFVIHLWILTQASQIICCKANFFCVETCFQLVSSQTLMISVRRIKCVLISLQEGQTIHQELSWSCSLRCQRTVSVHLYTHTHTHSKLRTEDNAPSCASFWLFGL